jgi:2-succinyl-5-enolpyruvyl-6-hydroxy-3-cyclohexene-1-carboxylate synthase
MELTNSTFAPLTVVVDELARCGVEHAVLCPGSRDAPLIYAFADRADIVSHSVLDERSAGFVALGIAKSTGRPVAVCCTSGTAAANLLPAVVEASESSVPLIVLTADRPPELRDVGAGQAIDQIKLYGSFVRWFHEAGNVPLDESALIHHRALACRMVSEAVGARPGPVHVNFPLREPLAPVPQDLTALAASDGAAGRRDGSPWTRLRRTPRGPDAESAQRLAAARRPLIVAGELHNSRVTEALVTNARRLGIPVMADVLSGLRARTHSSRASIVATYEAILRTPRITAALNPDFVLRVGELPTSKTLRSWLGELTCPQVVLDPHFAWHEATRRADVVSDGDPAATLELAGEHEPAAQVAWREQFAQLEETAQAAIEAALDLEEFPNEPAIARTLAAALPAGATVWLSSSMPVRDAEWFSACDDAGVRFLSNRGANGIDGVLASAVGAAQASEDPVVMVTGDLALLHDAGSLQLANRTRGPLTIVCVDNDGGGIFEFLPVASHPPHFEPLIATPSGQDVAAIASGYGLDVTAPADPDALRDALRRPGLIHLRTNRTENRAVHARIWSHVSATLLELDAIGALED